MNDEEQISDRRRAKRARVMLLATLDRAGNPTPVRITNISSDGAAFVGGHPPGKGDFLELSLNGKTVCGRLVWLTANRGGINFNRSLNCQVILRPISAPRRKYQPRHRRPGLRPERLNQAEQNSVERCFNLLGIAYSV